MIGDRVPPSNDPAPFDIGESLKDWLKQGREGLYVSAADALDRKVNFGLESFKTQLVSTVRHNQRLFTTKNEFLGLGKGNSAPGDLICILVGCSVPVILRQVAGAAREDYVLIGESYIHGLMDGEAVDRVDAGVYEWQNITIV
jgi:hypothetical protein